MTKIKIILIKPPLSPEDEFGDLSLLGSCEPPLGLCYLAAYLRANNIDVEIVDSIALKLDFIETADRVMKSNIKFVGLSAETSTVFNAAKVAHIIKEKRPEITTIIGGTHITALPEKTMAAFPQFDFGVIGEGEVTLLELLKGFDNGKNFKDIPGLIIRNCNNITKTKDRELIKSIDLCPMPAWDMLPDLAAHYYLSFYSVRKNPSISIVTSRGCGFKCTFCYQGVFRRKVRRHGTDYIMNMVQELYHKYGIREIRFQDDNFLSHEKNLITFCERLIKEKLDISWSCLARTENIKKDTLAVMKAAGCWQILLGIESGSQKILHDIKKQAALKQIEHSLYIIRLAGMRSVGYFMIGYPNETKETIKETIRFAKRSTLDDFRMNYIVPFPGTELYSTASFSGKLSLDWSKMNFFKGPCYIPENFSEKEIIYYRKIAFIQFYLRPIIVISYMRMMFQSPSNFISFIKGGWVLILYLAHIISAPWRNRMLSDKFSTASD